MFLTEQQIQSREEKFIELLDLMGEELYESIDESYELTEEDQEVAAIMMEYFVENYKDYSLREAAMVSLTGVDPNAELVESFINLALDESIGQVVANVVHGVHNWLTKHNEKNAAAAHAAAKKHQEGRKAKMVAAQKATKGTTGMKAIFKKNKAETAEKKHDKAVDRTVAASNKHAAAKKEHEASVKKHTDLKNKIDSHIAKAKEKIKSSVKSGAERVVAAAGRAAGHFD